MKALFIKHLRILHDGETAILDLLNSIIPAVSSEKEKTLLVIKAEEERKNINLLKKIFFQLNLCAEGEQDSIIRSLLNTENTADPVKETKFIFSTALSTYYTNSYRMAVDCAIELNNKEAAKMLMNCLQENGLKNTNCAQVYDLR